MKLPRINITKFLEGMAAMNLYGPFVMDDGAIYSTDGQLLVAGDGSRPSGLCTDAGTGRGSLDHAARARRPSPRERVDQASDDDLGAVLVAGRRVVHAIGDEPRMLGLGGPVEHAHVRVRAAGRDQVTVPLAHP